MRKFYVCTYSPQGLTGWTPAAGPFASKKEAESKAPRYTVDSHILQKQVYSKVFSRTALRRHGFPQSESGDRYIADCITINQQGEEK